MRPGRIHGARAGWMHGWAAARGHGIKRGGIDMTMVLKRLLLGTALTTTLALGMGAAPARADEQTVKLIKLLIAKGILSPGQATDLLKETAAPAHGHAHAVAAPAGAEEEAAPATPGQIRVTYVPQFIRKQIADEVRAQVMDEAQQEGWAAPNALPEWTQRFKLYGDLRMRYQADLFDKNNYNQFFNFNGLNSGSGFDANNFGVGANNVAPPPFLNTTADRNRFRLRARLGVEAQVDDWITADVRIGTGSAGATSPNQTLGATGDFTPYALWLDRAYFTLKPLSNLSIYAGRAPNPFVPAELMFYQDLQFDGVSAKLREPVGGNLTLFANAGAFPLFNTAFDFSTTNEQKFASTDSYMAAIQGGAEWQARPDLKATLAVGIFDYLGVQGAVSDPCTVQVGGTFACNTDSTRTPFWQNGNSVFAIRNIVPYQPATGNPPDPQYYGLASRFNVLDVHPIIDITSYHPFDVRLEGEFMTNLAFDRAAILNHYAPREQPGPFSYGGPGTFLGGNTGYMVKAALGQLEIHRRWDWNAYFGYRYLESDSTLSALADTDFHQGGTNAKGYVLGANVGIGHNTWVAVRLLSAQAISGPHYGTDSVQLDLNSSF